MSSAEPTEDQLTRRDVLAGCIGLLAIATMSIKAFSETDQTDDLKAITVPTLVIQGDDDQVVPYKDAALLQAKLLKRGTLKIYSRLPSRHADDERRRDQR
jgi:pimeloyl-ACP methyl ester carboxylesterase